MSHVWTTSLGRRIAVLAGLLLLVNSERTAAQQGSFVIDSITTARRLTGSNDALGVSFSWAAPDSTVMAVIVASHVNAPVGAKISSAAFKLQYRVGSELERRSCIAVGVRASRKAPLHLTSAASQNVEWTAQKAGSYMVTLVFINVPIGTREASLLKDGVELGVVEVLR